MSLITLGEQQARPYSDEAEQFPNRACRDVDPAVFFPERGGDSQTPKQICAGCEHREDCLEMALANRETYGIWGGTSERERRLLRRRRNKAEVKGTARTELIEAIAARLTIDRATNAQLARDLGVTTQDVYKALRTLSAKGRAHVSAQARIEGVLQRIWAAGPGDE